MNTVVWIVQGLLALLFCTSGLLLLLQPKEKLAPKMPFVNDYSPALVKLVAFSHILGALGIPLPLLLHLYPVLTPIAASCLAFVMILAMRYNLSRQDRKGVVTDLVFGVLFVFIAYYRFKVQD
jgi:hypothetical protein